MLVYTYMNNALKKKIMTSLADKKKNKTKILRPGRIILVKLGHFIVLPRTFERRAPVVLAAH